MKEIFERFINETVFIKTTDEFLYNKGQFKITGAYDKFLELNNIMKTIQNLIITYLILQFFT